MADILTDTVGILGACLLIALLATGLVLLRPAARRRRRRRRHSARPKIDLFVPAGGDPKPEADA